MAWTTRVPVRPHFSDPEARFLRSVSVDDPKGCWEWTGYRDNDGYGRFRLSGSPTRGYTRKTQAHRAGYLLFVGPIPAGLVIDHLCRNRGCVNPAHLEPVTPAENTRRGIGSFAARTHCPQGHPYDETNTYHRKDKRGRECRACLRARRGVTR